ncbi:hypothetical protein AB0N77_20735 [Streptomyces misionensis]|uniref:hypothetical protein n=1 Tax=Streptomyces misionensis TaxID=67331 RepID=UPI0034149D6A
MPAGRPIALAAVATALTLLTACGHEPLKQGTVKDKRGHAAYRTPTYTDTYRDTNCRTVTTNALTLSSFSGRTTGGTGGFSKSKPAPPAKKPAAPAAPQKKNRHRIKQVCDRVRVSHRQTGWHWTPAHWELKLKQGKRTEWVTVNQTTWEHARIDHKIKL